MKRLLAGVALSAMMAQGAMAETVGVFLYFRDFLYDSVIDVYQASGQRAAREWAAMHHRIAAFTNAILLALVAAHEAATHS